MDRRSKLLLKNKLIQNNQIKLLNMRLLIALFLTVSIFVSKSQGCRANKDFTRASVISNDPNTDPYVKTFFETQTCFIHMPITDGRECYIYCNSGLESCVAFTHIGRDCYICDKEVNATIVPQNLRPRIHVWKSHLFTLDPCASAPCDHGNCTITHGSFQCVCQHGYGGRLCDSKMAEHLQEWKLFGNVEGFCLHL